MCQEKKEEEESAAYKIAPIQRFQDYIEKMQEKSDYSDQKQYRQNKHQLNKNN